MTTPSRPAITVELQVCEKCEYLLDCCICPLNDSQPAPRKEGETECINTTKNVKTNIEPITGAATHGADSLGAAGGEIGIPGGWVEAGLRTPDPAPAGAHDEAERDGAIRVMRGDPAKIHSLTAFAKGFTEAADYLKNEADTARAEVARLSGELEEAKSWIEGHQQTIIRRTKQRDVLQAALATATARIEALEGALRKARTAMQFSLSHHGCDPCGLIEAIEATATRDAVTPAPSEEKP